MVAGYSQYDREEDNRERKPEQEADIGRAPNAKRTGQLSLHRVARDLAERGRDGEGDPERGDGEHVGESLTGWKSPHRAGRGSNGQPSGLHATSTTMSSLLSHAFAGTTGMSEHLFRD